MMLEAVLIALGDGTAFGVVLGNYGTRFVLGSKKCPRCQSNAAFEDIRYRCGCGEVSIEEEL